MNNTLQYHSIYKANDDCSPYKIYLQRGHYMFELWGASGGGKNNGKGAYAAVLATINKNMYFYAYIGTKGEDAVNSTIKKTKGGCNGGGDGGKQTESKFYSGSGGGGATDIRLSPSGNSYENRIIVAGGGGGSCGINKDHGVGGDSGFLVGYDSTGYNISSGGGTVNCMNLGQGMNGRDGSDGSASSEGGGGGGGGYYGGCAYEIQGDDTNSGGGGGSSFIQGYPNVERNDHYSFSYYIILDGKQQFLSPEGSLETGHSGDGFLRISYLPIFFNSFQNKFRSSFIICCIFCIISIK